MTAAGSSINAGTVPLSTKRSILGGIFRLACTDACVTSVSAYSTASANTCNSAEARPAGYHQTRLHAGAVEDSRPTSVPGMRIAGTQQRASRLKSAKRTQE